MKLPLPIVVVSRKDAHELRAGLGRVVYQHVDGTASLRHGIAPRFGGQVSRNHCIDDAALRFDFCTSTFEFFPISRREHDMGARHSECLGNALTGSSTRARYQNSFALKHWHSLLIAFSGRILDIGSCSRANCFYHQTFQVARRIFPAEIIKYALVESPFVLGAHYDPQGSRFIILMEDLETRDFRINNFLNDDNVPVLKSLLDNLARLHGHFWQTPRFEKDLNWVENQLSGGVEELLDGAIYDHIIEELTREKYKREFIDELLRIA